MNLLKTIIETERTLQQLGMPFWAKKLEVIKKGYKSKTNSEVAQEVLQLYGGWGTLNDNAFSDEDAPIGMSGEKASRIYLEAINKLHHVAKHFA